MCQPTRLYSALVSPIIPIPKISLLFEVNIFVFPLVAFILNALPLADQGNSDLLYVIDLSFNSFSLYPAHAISGSVNITAGIHFELFEAITFFDEISIRHIGYKVITVSFGQRGSGEWIPQDSIRFMAMLSTSIFATALSYAPFYGTTILKLESDELTNFLIIISTIFITLYSIYLVSIYKKVTRF